MDNYPQLSMDNYPLAAGNCFNYYFMMEKSFRDAFIERIARSKLTVAEVARGAGVSKDMLNKLKQGSSKSINVDAAIKVAWFFGLSVNQFVEDTEGLETESFFPLLAKMAPEERLLLSESIKAFVSLRDHGSRSSEIEDKVG